MAVSSKFILQQGPVIASMGRLAVAALRQSRGGASSAPPAVPGPEIRRRLPPRPAELVKTYARVVGGDPSAYRRTLPPHLFPQWGFALATEALTEVSYPLVRVMNAGCRLEVRSPVPSDEPLEVRAQLVEVDDDGRRALLTMRVVTGTASAPEALIGDLRMFVPLGGGKKDGERRPKADKPRVPSTARELAFWRLGPQAGLDFAKLTGDFNPIHWVPAWAKASGFRNTILHGFATMARAWEGLNAALVPPGGALSMLDVRFTRPLVLPARVGLYVQGDEVFVGDAAGGPAYLMGSFSIQPKTEDAR